MVDFIRDEMKTIFEKYTFKTYKETQEQWISRKIDSYNLLMKTDMNFLEIYKEVRNMYNRDLPLDKTLTDIIQNSLHIFEVYYNTSLRNIKERYADNYEEVRERMMFRIELYKNGWSIEQIERYIYKYLLKEEYPVLNLELYECLYHNVMTRQEIYKQEKERKLGRPTLPKSLKTYIKDKHKNKLKIIMRKKYENYNKYESIKDHLLTKEEIDEIKSKVNNPIIVKKLDKLKL